MILKFFAEKQYMYFCKNFNSHQFQLKLWTIADEDYLRNEARYIRTGSLTFKLGF